MMPYPYLSVYIHIPFCRSRCNYCDFNTYADKSDWIDRYIDCIISEVEWFHSLFLEKYLVHTIYFGGGSPDLLQNGQFKKILDCLARLPIKDEGLEISTELNPGSLTQTYLRNLKLLGINRISLGMQSAIASELEMLGRIHSFNHVKESVFTARRAGFQNINLDLIYGIPGQSLDSFKDSLNKALDLEPDHLSLYALHLEPHTPMGQLISNGTIKNPDDDLAADMYEWAMEILGKYGFKQYEISNWARLSNETDFRCAHNLQYWHNLDYLGIGAGAHSFVLNKRWENMAGIPEYCGSWSDLKKLPEKHSPAMLNERLMTKSDQVQETIMMGLRLTEEGILEEEFFRRFGRRIDDLYPEQINRLLKLELLEWGDDNAQKCLRLTPRGRLVGNQVFMEFIEESG